MTRLIPVCLLAALATACNPRLTAEFLRPEELPKAEAADRFPDAPAVVLYSSRKMIEYWGRDEAYTQLQAHEVIEIRTEEGRELAQVQLPLGQGAKLVEIRARRIAPDGSAYEVPRDEIRAANGSSADPDSAFSVTALRVPDVKVGSRLEFVYTIEYPWPLPGWHDFAASIFPVRHYEADLLVHGRVLHSVNTYHASPKIDVTTEGEYSRIRFALDDVPAHVSEPWGPSLWMSMPFWILRVDRLVFGSWTSPAYDTWTGQVQSYVDFIRDDKGTLGAGFKDRLDTSGCASRRCVVDRGVDFLRTRTDLDGTALEEDSRPFREVLDGVNANAEERTLLLHRLLVDAGVDARIALYARLLTRPLDPSFPGSWQFDAALIYVPKQDGIDQAVWIDPACESCAAGVLPSTSLGVPALVLPEHDYEEARFERVTGKLAPPRTKKMRYAVAMKEDGAAEVTAEVTVEGEDVPLSPASERREKWANPSARWAAFATDRARTAQDAAGTAPVCDERAGRCTNTGTFRIPSFAIPEREGWRLPLSLFATDFEGLDSEKERKTDLYLHSEDLQDEVISFELPPNMKAELPADQNLETDAFTLSVHYAPKENGFEVRRTFRSHRGMYPKSSWPKYREVLQAVSALRSALVAVRPAPAPASASSP